MKRKNLISSPLASSLVAILVVNLATPAFAQIGSVNSDSDTSSNLQNGKKKLPNPLQSGPTTSSPSPSPSPSPSASPSPSPSASPTGSVPPYTPPAGGYINKNNPTRGIYYGPVKGKNDPTRVVIYNPNPNPGPSSPPPPPPPPAPPPPTITPTATPPEEVQSKTDVPPVPVKATTPGDKTDVGPQPDKKTKKTKTVKQVTGQDGVHKLGNGENHPEADLTAPFDPKQPCQDQAMLRLFQFMNADHVNTLGLMFELTAMRIARRALKDDAKTEEQLSLKSMAKIQEKVDADKGFSDTVKDYYDAYGKHGDMTAALKKMSENKNACYWIKKDRLDNTQSSAMVLAMSIQDPDSGLTDVDAGTIFTIEKLRAASTDDQFKLFGKKGKEAGNLLNISTRVARYLGKIQGGTDEAKDKGAQLDKKISEAQSTLDDAIETAYNKVKDMTKSCFEQQTKKKDGTVCDSCTADAMAATFVFDANKQLDTDEVQKKLLQMIAKSDNEKVQNEMKLHLKDAANFDLSSMFSQGDVPYYSKKAKDKDAFDPCWNKNKADRQPSSGK